MGDQSVQRRLAAVLAADVAGYTRLMEQDTDGTVAAWQAAREDVIKPRVADHSGKIVKLTGDGFLVEFSTVQDAVNCAIAMQSGLASSSLDFRMGINLGDIVDDGEDIHGEGVNVAARLEGLADPGGICISGSVHEQVRNRIEANYEDLGEKEVKNVSAPVRVYRVAYEDETVSQPGTQSEVLRDQPLALPDKPSIAVLPFDNMSNDPEQEYFSDGITEDVITELSKISGLFVIARHSAFTYKGKSVTLSTVGRELGVRYVLEGSVRKAGDRLRITAQLVDAATDHHVWADRYDRKLEDVFAVQDEVARSVAAALAVALKPDESERLSRPPTDNIAAYDLYLRSRATPWPPTRENILSAQKAYKHIIKIDPTFVGGHAGAALTYALSVIFGHSDQPEADAETAIKTAEKALAINDQFALGHSALGLANLASGRHDAAVLMAQKAIDLQPSDGDAHAFMAMTLISAGRGKEACQAAESALRLDPQYMDGPYLNALGVSKFVAGKYDEAIDAFKRNEKRGGPIGVPAFAVLAASFAASGRVDEARESVRELLKFFPEFSITRARQLRIFNAEDLERLIGYLHKAGLPE